MKHTICAVLLASSASAFACPTFSGAYLCKEGNKRADELTVIQNDKTIAWTDGKKLHGPYNLNGETKGKTALRVPVTYTVSCENDVLVLRGKVRIPFYGVKTVFKLSMTKTANGYDAKTVSETGRKEAVCTRR